MYPQNLISQKTLRPYQIEDIQFLKSRNTAGCFNEQRTGKTPTAIVALSEKGCKNILVLCPKSAIFPWADQFIEWSNIPATPVYGTPARKKTIIQKYTTGALIVSYDSFKATKRSDGLLQLIMSTLHLEAEIIDEAHRIKERTTATAKAVFETIKYIPIRLALTGTPAKGKPHDIWSILYFLDPKRFSSYWKFIDYFFYTRLQRNNRGQHYKDIGAVKSSKKLELQQLLNEYATQRKRKDVMPWLPNKEPPIKIRLPATPQQIKYLQDLKDFFETEHITTQGVLDRLIRYRQICLHPALLNLKGSSPKLEWIKDYLTDYPEQPTIIFSKFTSFIKILSEELTNTPHYIIIGATPETLRNTYIQKFQTGQINLLLINIDVGKESLTLDRAEAIVFTDKYPPVGDIEQATDRFIATTPDKANKQNLVYELILRDTYDEHIYELLDQRASALETINNFKNYIKGDS